MHMSGNGYSDTRGNHAGIDAPVLCDDSIEVRRMLDHRATRGGIIE